MPRGIYPRKNPSPYMKKELAKLKKTKKPKKAKELSKVERALRARKAKRKAIKKETTRFQPVDRAGRPLKKRVAVPRSIPATAELAEASMEFHTMVVHNTKINPKHYVGNDGSQVIDTIENFNLQHNMYRGQAIQYMFRAGRKDTESVVEDLLKAIWFIKREIAHLGNDSTLPS